MIVGLACDLLPAVSHNFISICGIVIYRMSEISTPMLTHQAKMPTPAWRHILANPPVKQIFNGTDDQKRQLEDEIKYDSQSYQNIDTWKP